MLFSPSALPMRVPVMGGVEGTNVAIDLGFGPAMLIVYCAFCHNGIIFLAEWQTIVGVSSEAETSLSVKSCNADCPVRCGA